MTNVVRIMEGNAHAPSNEHIAEGLRDAAKWVAAGDYGDAHTVIVVIEHENGQLARLTFGKPIDRARLVGMLEIAAHRAMTE